MTGGHARVDNLSLSFHHVSHCYRPAVALIKKQNSENNSLDTKLFKFLISRLDNFGSHGIGIATPSRGNAPRVLYYVGLYTNLPFAHELPIV